MSPVAEAENLILGLPESERAKFAEKLIASLPSPFDDDNDEAWVEECMRRDREMDDKPETVMSHEEFFGSLREHIRR